MRGGRSDSIALFTEDDGPAIELVRAGELELAGDNTF
jgi:hypothetical protein